MWICCGCGSVVDVHLLWMWILVDVDLLWMWIRNSPLSEPSSSRHASTTGTEGSSIAGAAAIASSLLAILILEKLLYKGLFTV